MKTVLCDASPLIFLAKLDELGLIAEVLESDVFILQAIVDEVCSESADEVELLRIRRFLDSVTVVEFRDSDYPSQTLSENDRSVLNWSIQNQVDWLVADERLLRRIAKEEKIEVIGMFGILIAAARKNLRSTRVVKLMIDELVGKHGCRISVSLYQRLIEVLDA
jgi:predicted nucleic acid-binding protein